MGGTRKLTLTDSLAAAFDAAVDRHRGESTRLAIGYSGGLDSSVVLHLAVSYAERKSVCLDAVHCHHGLSPNADAWADHCRQTANRYGVSFRLLRLAIEATNGEGIEAAARRERYRAFDALDSDLILLGHHAGDMAETVLLNLLRGSGVLGMAGIPERRDRIVRPLLETRRTDIESYARQHGLRWCEDESNLDSGIRRNYVRQELIPSLQVRYPAVAETLAGAAARFAEAQLLLDDLAALDSGAIPLSLPYPTSGLKMLEPRRAANLLRLVFRRAGLQSPPAARLEEFLRQVREAAPDRHPSLRLGRVTIEMRYKHLHVIQSR